MSNIFSINEHNKSRLGTIENEASAWIVRLQDSKPSTEELKRFHSWLQTSPAHQEAFRGMVETWNNADILTDLAFPSTEMSVALPFFKIPRIRFALVCTGLLFLLTISITGWQYYSAQMVENTFRGSYKTAVGELKDIALPDGSEMRLNTGSKISVTFKQDARLVHLLEGEAHFEVFHDEAKPFVVYAGKVAIRAVGTAFSVYIKGDSVDVIVTEGKIRIASLPHAITTTHEPDPDTLLRNADTVASFVKGQHAVFKDKIELVETMGHGEIRKKLSWREGMLIFDEDNLVDVVNEISRYTPKKIVILDPAIRELKVGGYFRAGEITPLLDTLAANFDLKIEEINKNLIYLSHK